MWSVGLLTCPCVCTSAFVCVCVSLSFTVCLYMCVDVCLFVIDGALSPFPQLGPAG